ncbi:hypothetical protein FX988_03117 [Paraglaciecola mesophila]|uniref:Solute-binding protein family 3/N-terminal domain-containing protein n=1 Tax=Paraglaciecola mesophila TaxID=197222 RepID=A0A857JLB4_9ALTE|nr:transporter substrate-binding domain-containing protein [Paraglaciecola mesophila]QHJ12859.1 hypothetical protein FX988_03117 [Paraglaciecola mesophila]
MKYLVFFIVSFACFASANAKERLVFSTAVNSGLPPMVCSEVMRLALSRINIDMSLNAKSSERSILSASKGETDGETARVNGLNAKYPDLFQTSVSCYAHDVNLYTLAGNEFKVDGWQSIPPNKVIGYRKGTHYIEQAATQHDISIYPLETNQQIFKLISVGKIDMMIATEQIMGSKVMLNGSAELVILRPALERHGFYSYIHKKHLAILPQINQQLTRMKTSGELDSVQHKVANAFLNKKVK